MKCVKKVELIQSEVVTASYDLFEEYADHCISLEDRGCVLLKVNTSNGGEKMTAMYRRMTSKGIK